MTRMQILNRTSALAIVMVTAGLSLAACNKAATPDAQQAPAPTAAMALADDPSAPPLATAPSANALPPAPPVHVARLQRASDGYAFVDRGYAMSHAFADAPPDYTFDYDGVRPWVWQADDGDYQVVEPVQGGDRYYYYRQGSDQPFLVRDPDYSYGFEDGQLVVVYDRSGRALPDSYAEQRAEWAARDLARARAIYAAAHQDQHQAVIASHWRQRQAELDSERQQWADEQNQDNAWRAYAADHDQYEQSQWDAERYRRQAEAARYAQQSNDTAAAARFAAAAAVAFQASQSHRQGPPPSPMQQQAGPGRAGAPAGPFMAQVGAPPAVAPGAIQPGQGQRGAGERGPGERGPGERGPGERGPGEFGPGHARPIGPQAPAQAAASQQAAAQQAAAQAAAERQRSMAAAGQARGAQEAATQQQRTQGEAAAQQRAQAQGAAQQQARAQAGQATAERQRAAQAAVQGREAQQAAIRQQAQAANQAREAQQGAMRQQAQAAAQAREAQQGAARQQQQAQAAQAATARQRAVDAAAQGRVAQQAAAHQQAEAAHAAQAREAPKKPGEGKPDADRQKPPQ
jgi:hypothetical protein